MPSEEKELTEEELEQAVGGLRTRRVRGDAGPSREPVPVSLSPEPSSGGPSPTGSTSLPDPPFQD